MLLTSKRHPSNAKSLSIVTVDDVDLPEGLYIRLVAVCSSCDATYEYDGDPFDFDEKMSYCGRSWRCVP